MRTILLSFRQFQLAFWHQGDFLIGLAQKQNYLVNRRFRSIYNLSYNAEIHRYTHQSYMIFRALFVDAATVTSGEVGKTGTLIEYERRIAAHDLVDGDSCQVGTLRELQRLYDELVESADACQLDRYATSEKASRSWWLWSRFIPQSSFSPVKGLYLYGGVGTGKTMLMDLFFDQFLRLHDVLPYVMTPLSQGGYQSHLPHSTCLVVATPSCPKARMERHQKIDRLWKNKKFEVKQQ